MTNSGGQRLTSIRPRLLALGFVTLGTASALAAGNQDPSRITLPLTQPEEWSGKELGPENLIVRLDGDPQQVARLLQPSLSAESTAALPWEVVVYFDAPMITPDGLRQAAAVLARQSETLTNLGAVQIVFADPVPRSLLPGTRNPALVEEVLRDVRDKTLRTGELLWHRQRFSIQESESDPSQLAEALREEIELIQRQRQNLLRWLGAADAGEPKLLILVHNGHDLNPRAHYSDQTAGTFLEDPRVALSQADLSKSIAGYGWTTLCLALGPRPDEFSEPLAPLGDLARATGGAVVTSRRAANRFLESVSAWPLLQVELETSADAVILPLQVVLGGSEQTLKTRRWAVLGRPPQIEQLAAGASGLNPSENPVLQLLRPNGLALSGEVRVRTITGRQRIHEVAFLLDGREVERTARTPFSAILDLGQGVRPHTIEAVAYSRSGRTLGSDSLQVNIALEPPRVIIDEVDYEAHTRILQVVASVTAPAGVGPERVEFFLNERQGASLEQPPYLAEFEVRDLEPEDFVRVVALYPDGQTAEAARLPAAAGHDDELDVNLVELLAMVTSRNRKAPVELDREDFVVRQHGRPLPIDQFSRWEELQLTLGLVLDTSDSMDAIIEDAREAGERFFEEALKAGDEAFVVDFNNLPRLTRRTTGDSDRLLLSLAGLEARGMTALYDAIVFSLQQFENSTGRRALVVVTDGEDSASYYQPRECVRQARLHGVPVYLVVLGEPPDPSREPELLRNLMVARRSGGEVYYISDLDDLGRVYDEIVSELRRQYFLAFNTGHTLSPEELEQIEVEVIPKGVTVRTLLASQQRGG